MGIVLGSNFDVQTALPLDSRLVVADLTARDAIDPLQRYEGMIVYVKSEETNFQLVGGTANENWEELSGSGSGGGSGSGLNYISGDPEVYQGSRVITLAAVPVDKIGDAVTATSHGITTGQKVRYDTDGTEIGGLTSGTTYYAISATANALQFATSYENAKAGTAIDLSSDGSGTQTLTVDLDEATGGTPTVTVEETSDVSALTYKFSKDGADRFGEGLSFPVAIDAIDFEKTRKQIVTFFYKTSTDYVDRDIRVMLYDVKNKAFIEVKGGLDDNGELPASADIIEFRGYFHPASDSGNYRLAFNINSENTDAYDIYLGRVKITSEENIPVSGISPLIFGDDSHFEGTIGNWKKYKDAASEIPEDGDGGTPGIIFLRGTTKVLGGDSEGLLIHDGGSDYQGEGVALDIAVTPTNRAKDNKIQFFYSAFGNFTFGGFGSNSSVMVHLYDVTNGKHLNPYPGFLDGSGFYEGYCQIPHDCETIRLILHVATDSTDHWVLAVKKFQIDIAPNEFVKADSDWEEWTPTGSWTSNVVYTGRYRKIGDSGLFQVRVATTGAPTSANLSINMPSGIRIAQNSVQTDGDNAFLSSGSILDAGTALYPNVGAYYESETAVRIKVNSSGATGTSVNQTSPMTWANGDVLVVNFLVPIQGWTSGNLTAASANLNAPVVFRASKNAGSATADTTIASWTTTHKDTVGAFNATTGVYTVKVPGDYFAFVTLDTSGTTARMVSFYVNNVKVAEGLPAAADGSSCCGTILENLKPGDTVDVRLDVNSTLSNTQARNVWSMYRIETSGRVYKTRVAWLRHQVPAGTAGGSSTATSWNDRLLNTAFGDLSFVSLNASNGVFTLQPGTYHVSGTAMIYRSQQAISVIRDVVDNSTPVLGLAAYGGDTENDIFPSVLSGEIKISEPRDFKLQTYTQRAQATNGLGTAGNAGVDNIHAELKIEKVL